MVASICMGLDPDRVEILLIYAVRADTTPERFESSFPTHVRKIYVPEMVRPVRPGKDLLAVCKLYRVFRSYRPQVVHAHSSKAGLLGRLAAGAAGVPRIFYSPHGYSFRMTDVSWVARRFYSCIEWLASRIGSVVVNGPSELLAAQRLAGRRRVLPYYNGIDVASMNPRYAERGTRTLTVATCGRMTTAKNPEAFLRLSAGLAAEFPNVTFVWIGGGDCQQTQAFLDEAERLGLKGRIQVTGWLSPERARQELRNADVVVHYSRWDVLPTAVLEAMALGKPVVGSRAVEQIVDGVTGFVAGSEEELIERSREVLGSWELRASLGRQARKAVEEEYSLPRLIAQLERAYLE